LAARWRRPAQFADARSAEEVVERVAQLPSNHSSRFAAILEPTLSTGVDALVAAADEWLHRT
jgi:hippurate hydrolase